MGYNNGTNGKLAYLIDAAAKLVLEKCSNADGDEVKRLLGQGEGVTKDYGMTFITRERIDEVIKQLKEREVAKERAKKASGVFNVKSLDEALEDDFDDIENPRRYSVTIQHAYEKFDGYIPPEEGTDLAFVDQTKTPLVREYLRENRERLGIKFRGNDVGNQDTECLNGQRAIIYVQQRLEKKHMAGPAGMLKFRTFYTQQMGHGLGTQSTTQGELDKVIDKYIRGFQAK